MTKDSDLDILCNQFETFNTQQEVCDLLGITVEDLLDRFHDKLIEYASGDGDG